jgi:hypothetical protein
MRWYIPVHFYGQPSQIFFKKMPRCGCLKRIQIWQSSIVQINLHVEQFSGKVFM